MTYLRLILGLIVGIGGTTFEFWFYFRVLRPALRKMEEFLIMSRATPATGDQ